MSEEPEITHTGMRKLFSWGVGIIGVMIITLGTWWTSYVWISIQQQPNQAEIQRLITHINVEVPKINEAIIKTSYALETMAKIAEERKNVQSQQYDEIMKRLDRIEREVKK